MEAEKTRHFNLGRLPDTCIKKEDFAKKTALTQKNSEIKKNAKIEGSSSWKTH